jgi:hypothetical protein
MTVAMPTAVCGFMLFGAGGLGRSGVKKSIRVRPGGEKPAKYVLGLLVRVGGSLYVFLQSTMYKEIMVARMPLRN